MNDKKEKVCNHRLAPTVFFGDRELIDMEFIQNHYEYTAHNGNKQYINLQFCSNCGVVLVKF